MNFESYSRRFIQRVTVTKPQNDFIVEIPVKGAISCDALVFGWRRFSTACGSMYILGNDCEMLEALPNEESCYVRCHCNNTVACDGNLIVNVERDEHKWTLCPMSIA